MATNPSRWALASEVFHRAIALPEADRLTFIARECGEDTALQAEVESLVHADRDGTSIGHRPALSAGTRLGAYEIVGFIAAGGMGEVYRARDTRLKRDVALKILPESFASDPDRLARFQREAEVLASLNHPSIAAIYGVEESNGTRALVMEFVEGETLADRVARGPIPVEEALPIAKQIAEALEAAHEHGVIHRDLKPANIKVTPDRAVKVLDFGLAKLAHLETVAHAADITASPTITSPAMVTGVGMILGTASYMSPEQARGREADKRSDIWAFGCVLYEMLSGKRAFGGEDVSDALAFIITTEPDWAALPTNTPPALRRLLRRCLEKDPKERLHDVADARIEIKDAGALRVDGRAASVAVQRAGWRRALPWTVAVGALAVGAVLALWAASRRPPAPPAPVRVSAELGADVSLVTDQGAAAVLSPDGAVLAFVAQKSGGSPQLYIRRLEQLEATPLSGTDDARNPFFSPDGQWIAFFAGGKLKKISVTGGAAVTLCDAPNSRGGTWADDDTIAFAPDSVAGVSLLRVSSAGGKPERLTTLDQDEPGQQWPQVLPGGKAVLYTSQRVTRSADNEDIVVQPLPNGLRKVVVQRSGYYGRYLPSGHLVYVHEGTLFAAPFDLDRLELTGQPVPVLEGVTVSSFLAGSARGAQFAVAGNGTLVYVSAQRVSHDAPISWMDRQGTTMPLRATPANWANLVFAPDGRRLALDLFDGKQSDVWVYDWARDMLSHLTFDPTDDVKPVWTPDGRRIVFASRRADKATVNLYWQRADGTGDVQRLTESKNQQDPASWHPGGKFLAFWELNPQTGTDLMILPMEGDEVSGWTPGKATVFLNTPFNEREPMFSPDGRWIPYRSDESGRDEIYVRPFPGPGGKWQISTGGGTNPTWSRTRHELFYGTTDQRIMVAPYTVEGDSFRAEKPRLWSEGRYLARPFRITSFRSFDLHPDGERFALAPVTETQTAAKQDKLVLIFNFFDELRRLAPVKR